MGGSTTAAPLQGGIYTCGVWSEVLKVILETFASERPGHFMGLTLFTLREAMKTQVSFYLQPA